MKIAVTGGMGFIGHEVVDRLISDGHEVTVVDFWKDLLPRYESTRLPILEQIYRILPRCHEVVEPWDFVNNIETYPQDIVVHAGAVVNTMDMGSSDLLSRNVDFTEALAEGCSEQETDIIFFSSAAVYGSKGYPNNPYGLTKALGEKVMKRTKGVRTASLRLFNVFGRDEHHKGNMASVAWQISQAFDKGSKFRLHSPTAKRDFVPSATVVDVVSRMARKMENDNFEWHFDFDVGTGIPMSFGSLVDEISKAKNFTGVSPIEEAEIPASLLGRYQFFTCAGKNGVENLGGTMGTAEGIGRAYGGRK
jgi:ADP-L-glycero-D-manno-heptose 6-epimerase